MKILAISQVYYPDTASTAQHLTDLLEELAQKGHSVSVITSTRKYENPKTKFKKSENFNNVEIKRLTNTGFGKKNRFFRLLDFLSFNLILGLKLLFIKRKKYDVILGMTSPPLLSYIGVIAAKIKRIKFVYWTMDLQPELSIVANYIKADGKTAKSLQNRGDYIFRKADKIITLDNYMQNHILNRVEVDQSKIDVIPVWPVVGEICQSSRSENKFRLENNFGNKIVVMYSGNHSVMHPLTTLLESAVDLKDDDRFLFVHIGGGERLQEVKKYKTDYNLENVVLLPYQPREKIHISLGAADIQVVSLGEGCVGYTHPNKIYGAMYLAKPILYIGPEKSHITDIFEKCSGNISVNHGESGLLTRALMKFAETGENSKLSVGNNNRRYASKNFDPPMLLNKMVHSIENINQ